MNRFECERCGEKWVDCDCPCDEEDCEFQPVDMSCHCCRRFPCVCAEQEAMCRNAMVVEDD